MRNKLIELENKYKSQYTKITDAIENIINKCKRIEEAFYKINKSWSGSFVGYHGKMYYKNFEEPDIKNTFSKEWGGIYKIPDGWSERTEEEIITKIYNIIGNIFTFEELESDIGNIIKEIELIRKDNLIQLSTIINSNDIEERKIYDKIENINLDISINSYINELIPSKIGSRDRKAIYQGIYIPVHHYYYALALKIIDICKSINEIIFETDRLIRQLIEKRKIIIKSDNIWKKTNIFWILFQFLKILKNILFWLWKHKILSILLIIITLIGIDYSLAWKNINKIYEYIRK